MQTAGLTRLQEVELPAVTSVLAVCAHPDDESFGLGAVLHAFVARGAAVSVLCFTFGEASTLGMAQGDLRGIRKSEMNAAAERLGLRHVQVSGHPDGHLGKVPLERLAREVGSMARSVAAQLLVVFDEGGVTGHPDHARATLAALVGAPELPVLAWTVPVAVARGLEEELGARFVGRHHDEIDIAVRVDRGAQKEAIACHASQSSDNPVLWRRLDLTGDQEWLRWLRRPDQATGRP